jgi:nitroimidazol reductase NimA-like FMN-containing flavoprotein (pyridoxamine 5'-phosphate oxidase superfamily)
VIRLLATVEKTMEESVGVEALQEMERILREETVGYVGLSREGEAYVVPVNYFYADGTIAFH